MKYQTVNPATEEILAVYETMSAGEVSRILAATHAAYLHWRDLDIAARAQHVARLAPVLRAGAQKFARLVSVEMGKPIVEARAEIEKCAYLAEVCAEKAAQWLHGESVVADGRQHWVVYQPLGVTLGIMPWNFPFWQALRFAVPALLAGNTCILKHASNVPQCALAIEECFISAGFPEDVFRTVLADHQIVVDLIRDSRLQGVSLTGSTAAGVRIGEIATRHIKKVVLELGGSDPFVVLDDADVEIAAHNAVRGRMIACGQSCIAAKRFVVMQSISDAFVKRFADLMEELIVGDPLSDRTQVGAIVNKRALDELLAQLKQAADLGARMVTGGERLARKGYFLKPTVVTNTTPEMRILREEVFGPVAPIVVVDTEEEALRVANDTDFGLGGSVWTSDLERGVRFAQRLEAGTVFVNSVVKSDPRMPFGGIKKSGVGRELAVYGIREFVNVKGISVYDHV
jgi:succinate-semialdehyde dehydrogenase / glutarate-semialdehyde dehydrogenase